MKRILLFFLLLVSLISAGQKGYYAAPVKIPILLSASFAELRSNHFHSGIDIKTQTVIGIPVYAVADGFVSRISVSPGGYGNALYIDHYNGTTSVYGHLNEFSDDIQRYVKKFQYLQKSFKVDIAVSPELFLVEKGDLIAKSGNSGSSGGPHLHFEIRDTKTEESLNPLDFGFDIADQTPPKIYALLVSPLSETSHINFQSSKVVYPLVFANGKYRLPGNSAIRAFGKIGFAIEANDFFDLSANRCGINTLEMKVDGTRTFLAQLNRFSFSESRYINSYVDYEELTKQGRRFQKTWIDPGNRLRNYEPNIGDGVLNAGNSGQVYQVEIEINDAYGNSAVLEINVESTFAEVKKVTPDFAEIFEYDKRNGITLDELQLDIPEGALYSSFPFEYKTSTPGEGYFSDLHQVHFNTVPLHIGSTLKIKTKNLNKQLESKALLVNIDPKTNKYWAVGGSFENGWIKAEIRTLGTYAVRVDTVAPTIIPHSIKQKNALIESTRIRFTISDDLSGIDKIEGTIDGKWALFEYDAKNKLITHYFDAERFDFGKRHDFKLTVSDHKNNVAKYEATFWK